MRFLVLLLLFTFCKIFGQDTDAHMKTLIVKEIEPKGAADIAKISELLEKQADLQAIDVVNWADFPFRPKVNFRIAHTKDQIWIKFYVTEASVLALRTETNSATHRDSCVEFFIDPEQNGNYYNFEFNCIGVTHLAYGPNIGQRTFIAPDLIKSHVTAISSLGDKPFDEKLGGHDWEMTVAISTEVFIHQKDLDLKGLVANANFYKCADDAAQKHYLSWNPVKTERPNFHSPQFFGTVVFE